MNKLKKYSLALRKKKKGIGMCQKTVLLMSECFHVHFSAVGVLG